ncbi:MAG TPA: CPBP family intramembrane metalloprotease [Acidobacterium sp.]|uniref:Protease, CAAX amino terminal family n=2 Tax=Acidobacteriaceae TaxID=204434 RepID=C1F3V6_ACIC5|nr:protease, CAAX amino terminal family [Acidobacterium capsulatum ATCC 51196]HCT60521.1 CPBP family intramembrane metalloprotease [Acidobacterium sp.]
MSDFLPEDNAREQDGQPAVDPAPGQEPGPDVETARVITGSPLAAVMASQASTTPPDESEIAPAPKLPPLRPNLLHTLLFFFIAFVMLLLGQLIAAVVYQLLTLGTQAHLSLSAAYQITASDPRLSIPTQAAIYGALVMLAVIVFSGLWLSPFWETLEWRASRARRFFFPLLLVGLLTGVAIGALGNSLPMPMPKNPPILHEMSTSTLGAWFLLVFGITAAPMTEELAFRGFLLPSLLNIFKWLERRGVSNAQVTRWIGIPVSILLTTIPFTLLHAEQVSDSWGPLVLIGVVSVVLCVVRLSMKSVACGAVVHAAYNFTLFAGVVYQTSGFQHLNKLMGS